MSYSSSTESRGTSPSTESRGSSSQEIKMVITLQQDLVGLLLRLSKERPEIRRAVLAHKTFGLTLYALMYHTAKLTYPFSKTHLNYLYDLQRLLTPSHPHSLSTLLVIGGRAQAKTALAVIAMEFSITMSLQKYTVITATDPQNSSEYLYSIKNNLLTDPYLKRDFGALIPTSRVNQDTKAVNRQKAQDFIAENPLRSRFEAISTQQSLRGRLYDGSRITTILLDDIETITTVRSEVITNQIINQVKESENAVADNHSILLLGNKLSNFSNVAQLERKYKSLPHTKIIRIPLYDDDYKIIWDTKFVHSTEEANRLNEKYKVNLQSVQAIRERNDKLTFAAEHLASPLDNLLAIFKPEMFRHHPIEDLEKNHHDISYIFISLDTAVTAETSSDNTGITIRYHNHTTPNKHYVHTYGVKLLPEQLFNHIKNIYTTLRADFPEATIQAGWEKTMQTQTLTQFWAIYRKEHNLALHMYEFEHKSKKKEDRILSSLLHRYETGKMYHLTRENRNLCKDLEQELVLFPELNKTDDLCLAGDTLVETTVGTVRIDEITTSHQVLTRKGPRRVLWAGQTGCHPVITNMGITGTPNHPVITQDGVKELRYVSESDILFIWNQSKMEVENMSYTRVKNGTGTLSLQENISGCITLITSMQGLQGHYTEKSTQTHMERFLKVCTSIISTVTHWTTGLKTCSASQVKNTTRRQGSKTQNSWRKCVSTIQTTMTDSTRTAKTGLRQQKVKNGIPSIQSTAYTNSETSYANGALLSVLPSHQTGTHAEVDHVYLQEVETNKIRYELDEELGSKVYNLTIEGEHEFFANGILVHNCDSLSYSFAPIFEMKLSSTDWAEMIATSPKRQRAQETQSLFQKRGIDLGRQTR